jgi:hypothetical protein
MTREESVKILDMLKAKVKGLRSFELEVPDVDWDVGILDRDIVCSPGE